MSQIQFIKVLEQEQTESLNRRILSDVVFEANRDGLARGERKMALIGMSQIPEITNRLHLLYPNKRVKPAVRIYINKYGFVKPHKDKSSFNLSDTTVLLYLNEPEGGELYLQTPEGIISYSPKIGYAVVFPKETLHWSGDVYSEKRILIMDLE